MVDSEEHRGRHSVSLISATGVWKVFGKRLAEAMEMARNNMDQSEILAKSGCVVAVKDATFEVNRGEIFVVMGLSGSGKSTLIRCISRLIDATAGTVLIDGHDLGDMSDVELRELRRHTISMVFQNYGLFPHRRVIDNVAFGLEVRGAEKEERYRTATEMIELVGLDGWADKYPEQLSGGMKQRVGLARALAVDPEILLFDEPFSALDPLIRRDMQDELLSLQGRLHRTMVFITHDFSEALKLGDRIAIMRSGAIVQVGTPEEIVAHPADDYVREFTLDVPRHKVLSVGAVMASGEGPEAEAAHLEGEPVAVSAILESVLPRLLTEGRPVPVIETNGKRCGVLDPAVVSRYLWPR
jgi:glycine betaine/proline transport system ATP-binding protein